jgi:alanine racemase
MENITHYRPTKIKVKLNAIRLNIENLKKHLKPNVKIIAVVKANAYGHGDIQVAKAAIEAGASMLAVATPDEAVHIREHFPTIGILVLGASPTSFAPYAAMHNISLTVFSAEWVEQLGQLKVPNNLKLHIKIDSGMGRIGVTDEQQLLALYEKVQLHENVMVEGIFTHFATADEEDTTYFENQLTKFKQLLQLCPKKPAIVHAANTATALIKDESCQFDAVRFGISMYGLTPSPYVESILPFSLHRAMSFETELVHVKKIQAGDGVGYGASFIATEDCYIGTLPVGYADGVIRRLSGQDVLIDGKRVPIIGRICMDQCMILLPNAYTIGEKVVLIGKQGNEEITLDDWAAKLETINYEVPCILTSRVLRVYENDEFVEL